jgi:hypothetical protein
VHGKQRYVRVIECERKSANSDGDSNLRWNCIRKLLGYKPSHNNCQDKPKIDYGDIDGER